MRQSALGSWADHSVFEETSKDVASVADTNKHAGTTPSACIAELECDELPHGEDIEGPDPEAVIHRTRAYEPLRYANSTSGDSAETAQAGSADPQTDAPAVAELLALLADTGSMEPGSRTAFSGGDRIPVPSP